MRYAKRPTAVSAALALLAVVVADSAAAAGDDARDLVRRALEALPKVPFIAKLKLSVDRGAPRELTLSHKLVAGARASYLEVIAPVEVQGMRFLFLERPDGQSDQFMKIAASRKVIQVAAEMRKHSFLGSAFYVADLIEPALDAFAYTDVGEDEILRRRCRLIEAVPKQPAGALYAKMIAAIDPKDLLILKRLFVDEKGTLLKTWTVERVDKVTGYWTLLEQRMRNPIEKTDSRLEITEIKHNVELPDELFSPEHLAR
ncbi:MAG: outer membrane lipoprotein-sorting protein [Deltaproteobacteria bacterium]|nr:outer membrane lipoprotein-sorting protein [Deltaproteobacteria bacterium]